MSSYKRIDFDDSPVSLATAPIFMFNLHIRDNADAVNCLAYQCVKHIGFYAAFDLQPNGIGLMFNASIYPCR
ncbi:hypothetical protein CGG93_02645 [Vibrio parahaemolyticus]|nr:hypothetical protein [Vibrio parahaemolyticus]TOD69020.1 hypothetical protein CGJ61_11700 [Vibrio parahaemolyticus]TOG69726.1 hypothetical protein CGI96_00870 [Vibrio parahaemolyticus]TOM12333.1 hypothetical protein CGH83_17010 [Vibrio parahaemolyticus]TOM41980.1 hypothetical protein CGH80_01770 [Vibrio parahaemolyticus]